MIRFLLILVCLASAAEKSLAELQAIAGKVGETTRVYNLYLRTGVPSPDTTSGIIFAPTLSNPYGVDGLRLQPNLKGFSPYASVLPIFPITMDSGASTNHMTMLDLFDCVGGDSTCYAIKTRKGPSLFGDSLLAARLVKEGGGHQWHIKLLRESRRLAGDTDCVLAVFPGAVRLRDTLPLLARGIGQELLIMLYHQSGADSGIVLYPNDTSETIEGYDSLVLQSNMGRGWIRLLGAGDRWRVLSHHEEGTLQLTMSGVSGTVKTNALYTIDNLRDVRLRVLPVSATSNSAANTFQLTGLDTRFTDPVLDSTWNPEASVIGLDSAQTTLLHCVLYASGAGINCYRSDFAPFKASGQKGTVYGLNFDLRLNNPAPHL